MANKPEAYRLALGQFLDDTDLAPENGWLPIYASGADGDIDPDAAGGAGVDDGAELDSVENFGGAEIPLTHSFGTRFETLNELFAFSATDWRLSLHALLAKK